jgi:RimJ/RimL family protein N-acetyltransferase
MGIETARLILRRPRLADVPDLFEFLGDAEAMRYTHVDTSLRDVAAASPSTNGAAGVMAMPRGPF